MEVTTMVDFWPDLMWLSTVYSWILFVLLGVYVHVRVHPALLSFFFFLQGPKFLLDTFNNNKDIKRNRGEFFLQSFASSSRICVFKQEPTLTFDTTTDSTPMIPVWPRVTGSCIDQSHRLRRADGNEWSQRFSENAAQCLI